MEVCVVFYGGDIKWHREPRGSFPIARSTGNWESSDSARCMWESDLHEPDVKPVGEPDAANPHVRFDERGVETEQGVACEAPTTERVGQQIGLPKQPRHTSTLPNA